MLVLITYDVPTESGAGRARLRKVAKQCVNFGRRVQNSVFECELDAAKAKEVTHIPRRIINEKEDSLRFYYYLGNSYKNKIEHYGIKKSFDVNDPIVL
ncbi:MAG: CRISPR-associated endonuclease Cas2 [Clostridiales bacterium]|nr:CRISPR-associated endonuclease Cas2 [Clostridiales bacterium]